MMTAREQQYMSALQRADEIRSYRAKVKRDLKSGALNPVEPLMAPDPMLNTMKVEDYLRALPGLGKTRIANARKQWWITTDLTMADLTYRQRSLIAMWLAGRVKEQERYRRSVQRSARSAA